MLDPNRVRPPKPHPCASETFGARIVTVSLVTGNVYTTDLGPVSDEDVAEAALWVELLELYRG